MINLNTAFVGADKRNLILSIDTELQKQPSYRQWQGFGYFKLYSKSYDLVLITPTNILSVEFVEVNGTITPVDHLWRIGARNQILSPLLQSGKKVMALSKELSSELKSRIPIKVINLVVILGDADFTAVKNLPFGERVLSFSEFLNLLSNEREFNTLTRSNPKAKIPKSEVLFLTKLFSEKIVPRHDISEEYHKIESILQHRHKLYHLYIGEDTATDEKTLVKQWNLSHLSLTNREKRNDLINHGLEALQYIKIHNPKIYEKCLASSINLTEYSQHFYDECISFPDTNHQLLKEYLLSHSTDSMEIKFELIQSLLYIVSELHKIEVAHGDLNQVTIIVDQNRKVKLCQFNCAFYPNTQLADNIKKLMGLYHPLKTENIDPFQKDVYWLGYLIWTITQGKPISTKNIHDYANFNKTEGWLNKILYSAAHFEYANATILLEAFLANRPTTPIEYYVNEDVLKPYLKAVTLVSYEDTYDVISKPLPRIMTSYEILTAKAQLDKLTVLQAQHYNEDSYIPEIKDFGITSNNDQSFLYIAIPKSEIFRWSELALNDIRYDEKIYLCIHFIESLQHYHHLQYSYGDLREETISIKVRKHNDMDYGTVVFDHILQSDPYEAVQIDLYDHNHKLLNSPQQCDNYQALRILERFLKPEIEKYKWLEAAFNEEFKPQEAQYLNLSRLLTQLQCKGQSLDETITLSVTKPTNSDLPLDFKVLPDNGKIYLSFKRNKNREVEATLWGIGGKIVLICPPIRQPYLKFISAESVIPTSFKTSACLELNISIHLNEPLIRFQRIYTQQHQNLVEFLQQQPEFVEELRNFIDKNSTVVNVKHTVEEEDHNPFDMTTAQKWKLIKDTEQESLPILELLIDAKPIKSQYFNDYVKIKYEVTNAETQVLSQFDKKDQVNALLILDHRQDSFETKKIGEVDIVKSTSEIIYLKNCKSNQLKQGSRIILQSQADHSSHQKRKNALNTILKRESVIPNLIDYFEKNVVINATEYEGKTFDPKIYKLNATQTVAFQHILEHGPLSVLQGPPGTGKTEFISALVHFLFQSDQVGNVLVVSQSHEAVNTTVERIRSRFQANNQDISILRISNKEEHVSLDLLDTYSGSIIEKQKEFFKETLINRILLMGQHLNIPESYLRELIKFKIEIFETVKEVRAFIESDGNGEVLLSAKEFNQFISQKLEKLQQYFEISCEERDINNVTFWNSLEETLLAIIDEEHGIESSIAIKARALIDIAKDCENLIDAPHANFERFLAKTRQIVCGTCVGIGHHRIDISNQVFDFVIIDEAARSSSSELAIAMQSGKRILLVGDHKQLPPLYSTNHSDLLKQKLKIKTRQEIGEVLKSDFETVFNSSYGQQVRGELLEQYRMTPSIGNMVSECFYEGKLDSLVYEQPFDQVQKGKRCVPTFYQQSKVPEIKCCVTWVDTSASFHQKDSEEETSLYNSGEIQAILKVLTKIDGDKNLLLELEKETKSGEAAIGIICAYAEQKKRLRKAFNEKIFSSRLKCLVKIDTVDSYQGKQNRIIMFSVTRNIKDYSSAFLKSLNRVNVALSRAMDRLIIFGATRMWEHPQNAETPLAKTLAYIRAHETDENGMKYQIIKSNRPSQSQGSKRKGGHS